MSKPQECVTEVVGRIADVAASAWDACANPEPALFNPFLSHAFLRCLEEAGSVGARSGWTPRHLGNRFAAEVGLSPKEAARVVRFDRARRRLQRGGPGVSLAALAAEGGFYDQAHLAREFRSLAGTSPSRWRAEEFRDVQAEELPAARD